MHTANKARKIRRQLLQFKSSRRQEQRKICFTQ